MSRLGVCLLGIAIGIGVTSLFVFLRPSTNWEQESVRWQATSIGCGMQQGLSVECVPVADLRHDGHGSWVAIYGRARGHRVCYELWPTTLPPRRRACPSCAASECVR